MHTSTSTSPALTAATPSSLSALSGVVELTHLGVIRVVGVDGVKFLQGQLTQDVSLMSLTEARLAAYCNAKGRMQASFVVFKRSEDEILMVCSRDILAQTLKRLSMFVLRDKVKLLDASADYSLFGLTGDAIKSIAGSAYVYWAKNDFNTESTVFLYPGSGQARALWCAPSGTPAPVGPRLKAGLWEWLEVQSGIAMITQPIFEAFVPQMLNYESVGGVNFQKGCYPGQEVVARSQFRGTLKRRAYLVHCGSAMAAGDEVFGTADATQPCGTVAQAAAAPDGGFDAIVSMQVAAAQAGGLTLGAPDGAPVELLALPYPLLEDI